MPPRSTANKATASNSDLGLERIVFFSDAVMAIAITLLAIDLKVPELPPAAANGELPAQLSLLAPRIMSFAISFAVIGIYWSSHHRYFSYIRRYDGRLILLNLIFLFFIAIMPFVAGIFGRYSLLPLGEIIYAGAVTALGLSIGAIWLYASYNHRLVDAGLDSAMIRARSRMAIMVPAIFAVSIPFAFLSWWAPMAIWWIGSLITLRAFRYLEQKAEKKARKA